MRKKHLVTLENYWPDLNKVKPGDIIYFIDDNSAHIFMVRSIDRTGVIITLEDIKVIESTWIGRTYAKVITFQALRDYENLPWKIIRLKEK